MQRTFVGPCYARPLVLSSSCKFHNIFNRNGGTLGVARTNHLHATVQAVSKGFSSTADEAAEKKKSKIRIKKSKPNADKVVDEAIQKAEKGSGTRRIDPKEAAKGQVDYVQVQDWGTGKKEDWESLKVASFRPGAPVNDERPFYEQLARKLEALQAHGALNIAQGAEKLPPFERWGFSEER
eukprot:jgi/Botrbrau1/7969/Bobra.9_2s0120.1